MRFGNIGAVDLACADLELGRMQGGTSSLRAPAHHEKRQEFMVGRRGEAPLVPPY